MLAEHQVLHLLEHCEAAVGRSLDGIRGQLKSESHVRSAIWELIVADAVTRIGRIEYERPTSRGKTPDLFVGTDAGQFWLEAAFLLPRFHDVERRQERFRQAVWSEARRAGVAPGHVGCEFYGQPAPYGYEIKLPHEHDFAAFFRADDVRGFFAYVMQHPEQSVALDLGPYGASVRIGYVAGSQGVGGGSVVIEQPRRVEEHAVYRILTKKAKKYRSAHLGAPFVVCIGSERSAAVRRMTGPMTVSAEEAVREACRQQPVISGVIVVSIEDFIPTFGLDWGRRAVVHATANHSARHPLTPALLQRLNLNFGLVEYGNSWNEWEGVDSRGKRLANLGGSLLYQPTKDGYAITLPAHEVVMVLGGEWTAAALQSNYGMSDEENYFRRAASEGRPIVAVELVPHDPRRHDPPQIRITFGSPRPMVLQTRRP
ncbi:MAG: hypothetical protein ACXW5U_29595 [Thermoanaerobaculia bacterium]